MEKDLASQIREVLLTGGLTVDKINSLRGVEIAAALGTIAFHGSTDRNVQSLDNAMLRHRATEILTTLAKTTIGDCSLASE